MSRNNPTVVRPWHEQARKMRAEGMRVDDIAHELGRNKDSVRVIVRGVVCPVNHKQLSAQGRTISPVRHKVTKVTRSEAEEEEHEERRRGEPRRAPITLPKVSFQDLPL